MNNKLKNIATGLAISLSSIGLFFLVAEGLTRLYDGYFAKTKIEITYDDSSRLEGYTLEKNEGFSGYLFLEIPLPTVRA